MRFPITEEWALIQRGEPVVIDDVLDDSDVARRYREAVGEFTHVAMRHIRSWLGVPLALPDRVIGLIAVSHAQVGYFTPDRVRLVAGLASQAAAAIENARLYEQAAELAAVEERQRLARELHDSVSQALYGIALGARTARTLLDRDPERAKDPVEYVLSLAEAGLAEMRALIFELRPESLEQEGIIAALEKQAASLRARHGVQVDATLCDEPDVPLAQKEVISRIAQEALHNTVKHARATHVSIRLTCDDDALSLEIRDDGVGFDPQGEYAGHLGLRSMRERAANAGGRLDIQSAPGAGSIVSVTLPILQPGGRPVVAAPES
jgi:signal transduction histidine kinase